MTKEDELKFILENRELAILKKKSEIQKSDFSNVLFEAAKKSFDSNINKLEVLIYEVEIKKDRNEFMFEQYLKGYVLNHSVGMRYIKLYFCYDNNNPAYSQDKENYNKYYPLILNKEDVDKYGFFWAVTEAKNIEASSVVKGSNFLTPVLSLNKISDDTILVKLAISPSNVFDSHKDVHVSGIWKKTINENQYDLLLQEHDMSFKNVIADSITGKIKVYTENIEVKELLSKFNNVKSEPLKNTQGQAKQEPPVGTQENKIFINLLN